MTKPGPNNPNTITKVNTIKMDQLFFKEAHTIQNKMKLDLIKYVNTNPLQKLESRGTCEFR